jgi:foldase protein PrsA
MKETKTVKSVKVIKKLRVAAEEKMDEIKEVKRAPFNFVIKLVLIVAVGTILFLLAQKYRSQFLAGTVNLVPVSRYELNKKMAEKYGKQTFDEIVSERLLAQELKKNNIVVTNEEVDAEMAKIIKDYGSQDAFKAALTQYNLTEEKAKESVKQSLALKKMIEKTYKIEISDEAVKKYFDENAKTLFVGKKLEAVSAEIKDTLYQQEVYTKTQEWFTGVRKEAKVVSFI